MIGSRNTVGKFLISERIVQSAPIAPLRTAIEQFIHFYAVDGDGSVTRIVAADLKPSLAKIESRRL